MSANATRAALRAFEELALCVHEHGCIDENVYNDADGSAVSAGFQLGVSQVCAFSRCADEEERCREDLQCRAGLECSTSLCQPYAPECALRYGMSVCACARAGPFFLLTLLSSVLRRSSPSQLFPRPSCPVIHLSYQLCGAYRRGPS